MEIEIELYIRLIWGDVILTYGFENIKEIHTRAKILTRFG